MLKVIIFKNRGGERPFGGEAANSRPSLARTAPSLARAAASLARAVL